MKKLFAYLARFAPLSEELKLFLSNALVNKKIPKNALLLREGEVNRKAWYLEKGLVRCFYYRNGHEVTTWFVADDNAILAVKSLFEQKPSKYFIEALEDCIVWQIDYAYIQYAFEHYPEAREIRTRITDWYSDLKDIRIRATSMLSATKRYRYFEKHFGHLLNRLRLEFIASYLDMDVRSVTRARRDLYGR